MSVFADRLRDAVARIGAPLCVGLDPFPDRLPALFGDGEDLSAWERFFTEILALAASRAAIVKPQLGLFEAFGAEGYALARALTASARAQGLLVLLDAKRGDIGSTAEGYAKAALGPAPGFDADCVTVNPYLGRDSLTPFLNLAAAHGKGVAILARTSNTGAADLQDAPSSNGPLWERTAAMIAAEAPRLAGHGGWSGTMAVVGATWPEEARRARTLMPKTLFLVPGYGAQGASGADAVAGFVPGPSGLEGGIVSSSRAVLYPKSADSAASLSAWREAVAGAMDAAHAELAAACHT
ncbi:MAG: orotidine-5'-phosphate decarboxylase [Alphaproteobacteria bacterium]|nr:orotidine-5'-phosphate decarboxylase [Alphaproteobacteria bacterium]